MNPREPVPLLHADSEATSELRGLLELTRLDEPTPEQLASLAARLEPAWGPADSAPSGTSEPGSTSAPSASGGVASATASGLKLKVLASLVVAGLVGGSFQAGRLFERERAPTVLGEHREDRPGPLPEPPRAEAAPSLPARPRLAPAPDGVAAPPPSVKRRAGTPPRVATQAPPPPPPAPAAVTQPALVDEELTLLESAYQAIQQGDAAAALSSAEKHAARFAAGALAQEREVLIVDALVRLGRRTEAETRADAFRARYPTSTHLVRLQNILSGAGH
jgi:hypothetical protein